MRPLRLVWSVDHDLENPEMALRKKQKRMQIDPNVGMLNSNLADTFAKARADAMAQQKAMASFSLDASMKKLVMSSGMPAVSPVDPNLSPEMRKMLGLPPVAAPEKPVNAKRNWGELFRAVPDGVYAEIQDATDMLSFAGSRMDLHASESAYRCVDATGESEFPILKIVLDEDLLRRSDDAVARFIDRAVADQLVGQANDIARAFGGQPMNLFDAVEQAFIHSAQYPAIHFARKLVDHVDGKRILAFAIQWIYEPSLDDDDDEEDE